MTTGTIAALGDRDSGTIKRGAKEELFFHADALVNVKFKDLKKGDAVAFDFTESKKGPYATRVQRA